jgi:sensor domain CHASE-containing protein
MKEKNKILTIRLKILLLILAFTVFVVSFFYIISKDIILNSFIRLENDKMETNLKRLDYSVNNSVRELGIKLNDWANWDEPYFFLKDNTKDFVSINLGMNALEALEINAIVFINKEGDVVFSKVLDPESNQPVYSDEFISYIKGNSKFSRFPDLKGSFSGFVELKEGTMFFVSRPSLQSSGNGPYVGFIVFGKFISKEFLKNIGLTTQLSVDIIPYESSLNTSDIFLAKTNLTIENKFFYSSQGENLVNGYLLLSDINNKPISILKTTSDRPIYNQGLSDFNYFLRVATSLMLFFVILIILFFEFTVISRITKLNNMVLDIIKTKNFSKRLEVNNKDELGQVAFSINIMLDDIVNSEKNELDAIKGEKIITEQMKEQLEETSKLNNLMVGRELEMIKLKEEINRLKSINKNG